MLKKTIGLVVFLGVIIFAIGTENAIFFFDAPSVIIVTLGPLAMLFAHYKKGMTKNYILSKLKEYIIFSAWIGALIGVVLILNHFKFRNEDMEESVSTLQSIITMGVMTLFWGYLFAYVVDIFKSED